MYRPSRPASTKCETSSNATVMDEGCRIAHVLCDHALVLYQCMHVHGDPEPCQSRQMLTSVS